MFRTLTPRQLSFDTAVSASMLVVLGAPYLASRDFANFLVVLGLAVALVFRRLSPGLALGLAWLVAFVQMALLLQPMVADLAIAGVLYATAAYGSKPVRWLGFASAPLGALVAVSYLFLMPLVIGLPGFPPTGSPPEDVLLSALRAWAAGTTFFLLAWTLGLLARTWMRVRESRGAQAEAERAVVIEQERNRIARDMHDVVAHSLAVVIAQADGARYVQRTDPEAAEAALTTIATTAREALADVRVLLARLRHSEGDVPQPALADLDHLYESVERSGLRVAREETGTPAALSTASQLAVYRVVQEALTNALRHGDREAGVRIRFDWSGDEVRIGVRNRLRAGAELAEPGHGLTGMTERAALAGGRLTAGPEADDFVVEATLPVQPQAALAPAGKHS